MASLPPVSGKQFMKGEEVQVSKGTSKKKRKIDEISQSQLSDIEAPLAENPKKIIVPKGSQTPGKNAAAEVFNRLFPKISEEDSNIYVTHINEIQLDAKELPKQLEQAFTNYEKQLKIQKKTREKHPRWAYENYREPGVIVFKDGKFFGYSHDKKIELTDQKAFDQFAFHYAPLGYYGIKPVEYFEIKVEAPKKEKNPLLDALNKSFPERNETYSLEYFIKEMQLDSEELLQKIETAFTAYKQDLEEQKKQRKEHPRWAYENYREPGVIVFKDGKFFGYSHDKKIELTDQKTFDEFVLDHRPLGYYRVMSEEERKEP